MFGFDLTNMESSLLPSKLISTSLPSDGESDTDESAPVKLPFNQFNSDSKVIYSRDANFNISKTNKFQRKKTKENNVHLSHNPPHKENLLLETSDISKKSHGLSLQFNNNRPTTPTNLDSSAKGETTAPLTPTANLKMLFSAVSPEIRNMERNRRQELEEKELLTDSEESLGHHESPPVNGDIDSDVTASQESEGGKSSGSRKEKSLGLLCQKFLSKYPALPHPNDTIDICLDEVAMELHVERRRIYDIVNVLESVEIVSRAAKNKYAWHGRTNLVTTLVRLKALAETEGFAEQMERVKEYEMNREIDGKKAGGLPQSMSELLNTRGNMRKDKSLGIMSQKFLMLFLVSKPKTVNLDLSAKILIGDPDIDRTESAKFKTKIRRLYDIANILTSLELIRKVHVTEIRGRKPAFKYIGPDIDNIGEMSVCSSDGCHRPSSRHSLLDCVQNAKVVNIMNSYQPIQPFCNTIPANHQGQYVKAKIVKKLPDHREDLFPNVSKKLFPRHSSLEEICQVAETERTKLYTTSQPSSPVREAPHEEPVLVGSYSTETKELTIMQGSSKYHIMKDVNSLSKSSSHLSASQTEPTKAIHKLPLRRVASYSETRTKTMSNGLKEPTVISLSKDQIDAVLLSLRVPVPISNEKCDQVDAATQSSPTPIAETSELASSPRCDIQVANERTPESSSNCDANKLSITENLRCGKRSGQQMYDPAKKGLILDTHSLCPPTDDLPSPPLDREVAAINKGQKRKIEREKPSPLRALHLAPEFSEAPPMAKLPRLHISSERGSTTDLELASPLPEEKSPLPTAQNIIACTSLSFENSRSTQTSLVRAPLPYVGLKRAPIILSSLASRVGQPFAVTSSVSQPVQLIMMTDGQICSPTLSYVMPVAYSPPLTPNSCETSPTLFTYSQVGASPNTFPKGAMIIGQPSLCRPIPKEPAVVDGSNVAVTDEASGSLTTFFGHTPESTLPSGVESVDTTINAKGVVEVSMKDCNNLVRKLALPDIC